MIGVVYVLPRSADGRREKADRDRDRDRDRGRDRDRDRLVERLYGIAYITIRFTGLRSLRPRAHSSARSLAVLAGVRSAHTLIDLVNLRTMASSNSDGLTLEVM